MFLNIYRIPLSASLLPEMSPLLSRWEGKSCLLILGKRGVEVPALCSSVQPADHWGGGCMVFFPLLFGWSRTLTVTNISILLRLTFLVLELEHAFGGFFCLPPLAFPGYRLLQSPIWDIWETKRKSIKFTIMFKCYVPSQSTFFIPPFSLPVLVRYTMPRIFRCN